MGAQILSRHAVKLIYVLIMGAVVAGSLGAYAPAALLLAAAVVVGVSAGRYVSRPGRRRTHRTVR